MTDPRYPDPLRPADTDRDWPIHEPHCNDRCIHYIEGDGTVREAFEFPRVPRRVPGGINPRQGVVTDPSPLSGRPAPALVLALVVGGLVVAFGAGLVVGFGVGRL
jgi:hypothetical protein